MPSRGAALVVVHGREICVGRHIIVEQLDRFASPLHALIEFGVGLSERSRFQVCTPEFEAADPGVEQVVRGSDLPIASLVSFFFIAIMPAMILP